MEKLVIQNKRLARAQWGRLDGNGLAQLQELTERFGFSILRGDLNRLFGSWYVTHTGLIGLARRSGCNGISVDVLPKLSDPGRNKWVCRAVVYRSQTCKGFVGCGEAGPFSVDSLFWGAELRVAETRAVNRAIRKAYGIGICSVEELGRGNRYRDASTKSGPDPHREDGRPYLRDRLLLLIRQHQLDPEQVKRYALQFCGTQSLREASRGQVEKFVVHLSTLAAGGREKLIAQLEGRRTGNAIGPGTGIKTEEAA